MYTKFIKLTYVIKHPKLSVCEHFKTFRSGNSTLVRKYFDMHEFSTHMHKRAQIQLKTHQYT